MQKILFNYINSNAQNSMSKIPNKNIQKEDDNNFNFKINIDKLKKQYYNKGDEPLQKFLHIRIIQNIKKYFRKNGR